MANLTRKLPGTDISRQRALNTAKNKNDITTPGTGPLTANTETRLNAMNGNYNSALTDRANAKAGQTANTPVKDAAIENLRMYVSHFIQVFNLGVRRSVYVAAHRSFYQLNVNSEALPNMEDEDDVLLWANRLVTGDAQRILAGGAAMANPSIAQVTTVQTATVTIFNAHSLLSEALDTAEEALAALNDDTDSLIKRVWDEVETFFGEEEPSSKRENARRWGVIYVTSGAPATLTGLVKEAGVGRPNTEVLLVETGLTAITNAEGRYSMQTNFTGNCVLAVHGGPPDNPTGNVDVTIPEHADAITINVDDILW